MIEFSVAIAVVLIVGFSGLVHGTIGIGFPLIATPLLSLVFDVRVAIMLTLFPTAAVNLASMLNGGQWQNSLAKFWPLPLYALAGSYGGTQLILSSDPAPYALLLSLLIVVYLGIDLYKQNHTPDVIKTLSARRSALSMAGFGLLAGVAAGTTNVMLPILIIYALGLGLGRLVTVQVFNMTFLAGKLAQISAFAVAGQVNGDLLLQNAPLVLIALVALFGGMQLQKRVNDALFRRVIKALLALIAAGLVVQFFTL